VVCLFETSGGYEVQEVRMQMSFSSSFGMTGNVPKVPRKIHPKQLIAQKQHNFQTKTTKTVGPK